MSRSLLAVGLALLASACAPADAPSEGADAASVEVRMVRDAATGAELPRVTLPGRPDVEARVNARLDSLSASLACEPTDVPLDPDMETTFESRARATHAADDVLSVSVHASYFCGGPYPTNDANFSVTYDLTTGEAVPFEALFRDYTADRAAIAGVLQTTLAPAVAGGEAPTECADLFASPEAVAEMTFSYALADEGVLVQPEFPHVTEACAVEATVPYASLRAYARDGGVLARVADASVVATR